MVVINLTFDVKTQRMAVGSVSTEGTDGSAVATRGDDGTTVLTLTYLNDDKGEMNAYLPRCEFDVFVRKGYRAYKPFVNFGEDLRADVAEYILAAAVNHRLPAQLAFKEKDKGADGKEFYSLNRIILVVSDAVNANLTAPRDPVKFMEAVNRVEYDKNTSTFYFISLDGTYKAVTLSDLSEQHFEVPTKEDLTTLSKAESGDTATTLDDGKWYKLYGPYDDPDSWCLMSSFRYGEFIAVSEDDPLRFELQDTSREVLSTLSSAISVNGTEKAAVTTPDTEIISIYAPTVAGNGGSILQSRGENAEPAWIAITDDLTSGEEQDAQKVLSARQGAVLRQMIESEESARIDADGMLQTNIDAETSARIDADTALQNDINAETVARQQADEKLQKDVDSRVARIEVSAIVEDVTLSQDANSVSLNLDRYDPNSKQDADITHALPVASTVQAGVMTVAHVKQLDTATADINALKGRAIIYVVELDSASPSQEQLDAAYAAITPPAPQPPLDGTTLADSNHNKEYTWFSSSSQWVDRGQSTVSLATQENPGIVMGSTEDGKVYVEGDGTLSVVGWDTVKADVANNASAIAAETAARQEADEALRELVESEGIYQPGKAVIRTLGDGSSTECMVNHSLGTTNLIWSLRDRNGRFVDADVRVLDTSNLMVTFTTAPEKDSITMTIVSGGGMNSQVVYEQAEAQEVWEFAHDMGRFPQATVLNSEHTEIYAQISHIDENSIRITFNAPTAGVLILE